MSTAAKKKEEEVNLNGFVDTFWDQYEKSLDRARKLREKREEAYLNTVKEVVRFNQEFRGSLANLFQTTRQTSSELVKGVSSNVTKRVEEKQVVSPELKEQFSQVNERLEQLTMAPLAAGLEVLQRFEENLVEGSENFVNYSKERRDGFQKVTDGYVNLAKNNHKRLVNRVEESLKVFVGTK